MTKPTIVATDRAHLRKLVLKEMRTDGPACDLNHIDVSSVEDMTKIFYETPFIGDVSRWNTRSAQTMEALFSKSIFTGDISQWNTANVQNMQEMFMRSLFKGDLSQWDVKSVTNTREMFRESPFTGDLTPWRFDSLTRASSMFKDSKFQGGMPRFFMKKVGATGIFPISYRGSMNDYYGYRDLYMLFKEKRWVDSYLEKTFEKRVDRVHIEKMITLQTRPRWCTDKALFNWLKEQQGVCEELGLLEDAVMSVVVQQFQQRKTGPVVALDNAANIGDLFSTSDQPVQY